MDAAAAPGPWAAWERQTARLAARFAGLVRRSDFEFHQPAARQHGVPRRFRRDYTVPVAVFDWPATRGAAAAVPPLICVGGVASTAMRFAFLAADLQRERRVLCMDWVGRGASGWLADGHEYTRETLLEQLRQLVDRLGGPPPALLGSSLGGSVAIAFAARHPERVARLVLNDSGPTLERARRRRRAELLARHHVFRTPEELMRRAGAAQKHDGPVGEEVRQFVAWHQTRWSAEDRGRVWRHDPRAMLAYRAEAQTALDQWDDWQRLRCPVLLLRGMESDALAPATVERMRRLQPIAVAHVPRTGHTPVLCDRNQTHAVARFLRGEVAAGDEFSLPIAAARRRWGLHWVPPEAAATAAAAAATAD